MSLDKGRILITGATGFVGSHLVPRLVQDGYRIVTFGRSHDVDPAYAALPVEHVRGDVTDPRSLDAALQLPGGKFDCIFHMAGLVSYKKKDLARQININVDGTRNVLEAAIKANIRRVVHTSSIAAIGIPGLVRDDTMSRRVAFDESAFKIGDEDFAYNLSGLGLTYCDTKYAAERVVVEMSDRVECVMLNPGIIFGERDTHHHHHSIFKALSRGYWKAVPRGGIPFSDILDVVDAHVAAIDRGLPGQRHNLVSANLTFMEAASIFASIYHCPLPSTTLGPGIIALVGEFCEIAASLGFPFGLSRQTAFLSNYKIFFSSERAKKQLGFRPTNFAETVRRTAPYYLGTGTRQ